MRRRQPAINLTSDDDTDAGSYFDTKDKDSDPDTSPIDTNTNVEPDDDAKASWLVEQDNVYPPEYYINQENEFNKAEFDTKDYKDNTLLLFNIIKGR